MPGQGGHEPQGGGGGPVDEVGGEVLGQGLAVVVLDWLVQPGGREDRVIDGPYACAEREPVAGARLAQRLCGNSVERAVEHAVGPVRDVADQFGPLRRELLLEEPFEQALADLPGHWRLVPAGQAGGELPGEQVLLAAAAAVSRVQQQVHREGAYRPRGQSAADRTERGAGGLPADVITGPHRHGPGLVHSCPPLTSPRAASSSVDVLISRAPRLPGR